MCSYDFQSTSSSAPPTPLISAKEDTSVFGDDDDDDTTVGLDVPEECVDLLPERRRSSSHSNLQLNFSKIGERVNGIVLEL